MPRKMDGSYGDPRKPKCPDIQGGYGEDFPAIICAAELTRTKIRAEKPKGYYKDGDDGIPIGNPMLVLTLRLGPTLPRGYESAVGYERKYWQVLEQNDATPCGEVHKRGSTRCPDCTIHVAHEACERGVAELQAATGVTDLRNTGALLPDRPLAVVLSCMTNVESFEDRKTGRSFPYNSLEIREVHAAGWRYESNEPERQPDLIEPPGASQAPNTGQGHPPPPPSGSGGQSGPLPTVDPDSIPFG